MRSRIYIRGYVRPLVGPSVGRSVRPLVGPSLRHTLTEILKKTPFFGKIKIDEGTRHESTLFWFYKNKVYKNIEAEIGKKIRTSLETSSASNSLT